MQMESQIKLGDSPARWRHCYLAILLLCHSRTLHCNRDVVRLEHIIYAEKESINACASILVYTLAPAILKVIAISKF